MRVHVLILLPIALCLSLAIASPPRAYSSDSSTVDSPASPRFTVRLSSDGRLVNWWDTILIIDIFLDSSDAELSGFDFLVAYNRASLYNPIVTPSPMLADPDSGFGWRTFDYHIFPAGDSVSVCTSDMLKITAEMGAYGSQSSCVPLPSVANRQPVLLAQIRFLIAQQETVVCSKLPDGAVRFLWLSCMDNQLVSGSGDTIFVGMNKRSRSQISDDFLAEYPSFHGIQNDSCVTQLKSPTINTVSFLNGGLSWHCIDSGGGGADINANDIGFEESDAQLYGKYFLFDTAVFTISVERQRSVSDVNGDGIPLTLPDLITMERVVCTDATVWGCQIRTVRRVLRQEKNVLSIDKPVGAALFHIRGKVTPELLAPDMELLHHFDGVNTRIFIWSSPGICGKTMSGNILKVKGEIVFWELATYEGYKVHAELLRK